MQLAASTVCQLDLIGLQAVWACTRQLAGLTCHICCRQCVPECIAFLFGTAFKVLALFLMHIDLRVSGCLLLEPQTARNAPHAQYLLTGCHATRARYIFSITTTTCHVLNIVTDTLGHDSSLTPIYAHVCNIYTYACVCLAGNSI